MVAIYEDAVSRRLVESDMFDREFRVERDGWTFYVQAAKRPESIKPTSVTHSASVFGNGAIVPTLWALWHGLKFGLAARRPWSVGVLEYDGLESARRIHLETLPAGVEPGGRMREIAVQLDSGTPGPIE